MSPADHIARYRDVTQIFAPASNDPEGRRIFDDVAGHRTVGLDIDADTSIIIRRGSDRALWNEIADDVALDDRNPSALVEIADGHAEGRAVDGVARDDSALERKF